VEESVNSAAHMTWDPSNSAAKNSKEQIVIRNENVQLMTIDEDR
jgi:hypothetical protein